MKPLLIIVTGLPATGKTTLSKKLGEQYNLPVFNADKIKELIFDRVGNWEDKELFDKISKASYDLMYDIATQILSAGGACIIEAHFKAELAEPRIAKLKEQYDCNLVQIKLKADGQTVVDRYLERRDRPERHRCHGDYIPQEEFIKLNGESKSINIDGETVIVDTTDFNKIDWTKIFQKIDFLLKIC